MMQYYIIVFEIYALMSVMTYHYLKDLAVGQIIPAEQKNFAYWVGASIVVLSPMTFWVLLHSNIQDRKHGRCYPHMIKVKYQDSGKLELLNTFVKPHWTLFGKQDAYWMSRMIGETRVQFARPEDALYFRMML